MKFIADSMLGRLARYMRAAGYDVAYFKYMDDTSLLELASSQDRIILTRDSLIQRSKTFKEKQPDIILIVSSDYKEQLKQLKDQINLKLDAVFDRCIYCNRRLESVSKEDYKESIPSYPFKTCHSFMRCSACNRLYWYGSHCKKISQTLSSI